MSKELSPKTIPDLSLEDMVSSLHAVHLTQQTTIAELDATISTLQLQLDSAGDQMKIALADQSLLSKENIWLTKDIKTMECETLKELEMELDSLVFAKNAEISKMEHLKKKQKALEKLKENKTASIESYMKDLSSHSSKYITEKEMQEQENKLHELNQIEQTLEERIRSTDECIDETSAELRTLKSEDKLLQEESEKLRQQLGQQRVQVDKAYDDQVKILNEKMKQLRSIHSANKNQLRELNRIISSQRIT